MNLELQWACNELTSALIEGGAQGLVVTGLIWGLLKVFPRTNAATRHAAWFATLIVVALLPLAHFARSGFVQWKEHANVPSETADLGIPIPSVTELPIEEVEASISPFEESPSYSIETAPAPEVAKVTPGASAFEKRWRLPIPTQVSQALIGVWLLLALTRLCGLIRQLAALRSIKNRSIATEGGFRESFSTVADSMHISRQPRLLITEESMAPMVVGFLKPAMLLPRYIADQSKPEQLEHLFRHELAHLARRDDWSNLAQQIIAAIFFFHPAILYVSRRLTNEREIACDDHALAMSRAPREYALFLTEFASQMKSRDFTAAPAAWSSNSQLKERIGMILNGQRNASTRVSRVGVGAITATALTLALAALAATPRFVSAAEEPKAEATVTTSSDVAVETTVRPNVAVAVEVEPVEVAEHVITFTPAIAQSSVSIASITTPPREKMDLPVPAGNVNIDIVPPKPPRRPAKVASTAQPEGIPDAGNQPRPKPTPRLDRDDRDVEHRLDRLERLVEDLVKREKRDRSNKDDAFGRPRADADNANFQADMERVQREVERAKREAEHAARNQQFAMRFQSVNDQEWNAQLAARESLKARRHALEAQRKQLDKEMESLEKEMRRLDEAKEKLNKDREKNNSDVKEKKHRDNGGDKQNSDDEKSN